LEEQRPCGAKLRIEKLHLVGGSPLRRNTSYSVWSSSWALHPHRRLPWSFALCLRRHAVVCWARGNGVVLQPSEEAVGDDHSWVPRRRHITARHPKPEWMDPIVDIEDGVGHHGWRPAPTVQHCCRVRKLWPGSRRRWRRICLAHCRERRGGRQRVWYRLRRHRRRCGRCGSKTDGHVLPANGGTDTPASDVSTIA
jgi:hypothetical protein